MGERRPIVHEMQMQCSHARSRDLLLTFLGLTSCFLSCCSWVTQKGFEMAVGGAPEWDAIRIHFFGSDEDFVTDVRDFIVQASEMLNRINSMLEELDLVDTRKSV